MKSPGDLMKDPFYAQIMFRIETLIHEQDLAAQAESLTVKDSDAKSAIRKALGFLKGKPPKQSGDDLRDIWIMETAKGLFALGKAVKSEQQLEEAQFCRALLAVEDSLKTRREMNGHSRGYLDFLRSFIEEKKI